MNIEIYRSTSKYHTAMRFPILRFPETQLEIVVILAIHSGSKSDCVRTEYIALCQPCLLIP